MLYGGRTLTDWVLEGGRAEHAPMAYRTRLRWHAFWFEHNWSTQTVRLDALPLPQDPIFIIGPWRSGTTVLHELLAFITGWATPRTWQCFNPSTCFLVGAPAAATQTRRPMDEGVISTHGPQEDEFAALLLGEDSVYRGFIDPRRLRACAARLWRTEQGSRAPQQGSQDDLSRWLSFIRGIGAEAEGGRLLLKSPNHTFRLPWLQRCFPRARFIWIGRHSQELLASNTRMWRAMMARYALWQCPDGELEGFIGDTFRACADVLSQSLEEISPEQLLWVSFEDLRANPRELLRHVLDFLSVERDAACERRLAEALGTIPIHPGSRAPALADADAERLDRLMRTAQQRFGGDGVAQRSANR